MNKKLDLELEAISKTKDYENMSDNMIIHIGFSLFILGGLNALVEVSDSFIIGASLSGFCFTIAEVFTLNEKFKKYIKLLTAAGVYCFFLFPIFLLAFEDLGIIPFFKGLSDIGTFYALAFIIIAFAIKSNSAKNESINRTIKFLDTLSEQHKKLKIVCDEQEEKIKEYQKQFDKLKEEFELLKADSKTNISKEDSSE